jgi:predicted permease
MPLFRSLSNNLFRHRHLEQDLDQEVRSHLELLVEQNMAKGMDDAAARRTARLELGGAEQVKDAVRDGRRGAWLEHVWRDVLYGWRVLSQAKGWTAVIVVSLALGIGANTALFNGINGLLFRKVPVSDPDTLVRFRTAGPNQMRTDSLVYGYTAPDARGRQIESTFSYQMYQQFVAANRTMSGVFACAPFGRVNLVVNGQAEIARAFVSSGNYFQVLGVTAGLGRTITPDDDRAAAPPVAVLSHRYWLSRFGGRPNAVGSSVGVNGIPVTIVGVLAPAFTGIEQAVGDAPDVSLPIALASPLNLEQPRTLMQPNFWWLEVMGRLKPGVTAAQVQGNLAGAFQQTARAGFDGYLSSLSPEERSRSWLQGRTQVPELQVDSGSRGLYDVNTADRRAVIVITGVVALVLLLVCANVANLLLSRAAARHVELSVRLALGATRARLMRQLLTESLLLASMGGALGIVVGRWGQQLLPGAPGHPSPLDWRVLTFVIAVTTLTGVVFGMAPAVRATRTDVNLGLKEHSRSIAPSRSPLGRSLVVAQVAISLVLLIGAGLFLRTLQNLRHVNVGFNPQHVALFDVSPALNRYDAQKRNLLYERIGERLRAIGGVRSVAWSSPRLMSGRRFSTGIFVQGHPFTPGQADTIALVVVSPTFFETMEMSLLAGRGFTPRDTESAPLVAVVNEAAARTYFPHEWPIGRRFGSILEDSGRLEIIGIVRDAKYNSVRDVAVPTLYAPYLQWPQGSAAFEVRTTGDPLAAVPGIREAVRQIEPTLSLINVNTQVEEVEGRFLQERVFTQAYELFGGLALLIASVGLFGVMSYSVTRQTNEIGIRIALGARGQDVRRLVMRESMILVGTGITIGVCVAIVAGPLLTNLLFGLAPTDPTTIASAIVVTVFVSALAGYLPAHRASRVDPLVALRSQ